MKKYSVSEIKKIIGKNLLVIILFGLVFGAAFGLVAKHRQSTDYIASRNMIVSHSFNKATNKSSLVEADRELIPTYQSILKDEAVAKAARQYLPKKIRKDYKADDILESVTSSSKPTSLIITIHAKTDDAKTSIAIVNAMGKAFQKKLPQIDKNAGSVSLLSKANEENVDTITKPSAKKYAVVGAALGVLVGMILSFSATSVRHFTK